MARKKRGVERFFFFLFVIIIIILAFIIIKPFLSAILTGLILSYVFYPLFRVINKFIKNKDICSLLLCIFIVAIILVLVMLVIGAVQWIFSGGDKEALTSARGRIINSLIGLAILAVAFAIFVIAGQFLGFPVTDTGLTLPIPRPTI